MVCLGKGTKGYDCLVIPGAAKGTMCESFMEPSAKNANRFCGNSGGLAISKSANAKGEKSGTICSKLFSIFLTIFTTLLEFFYIH